jgi:hypothetical protein
MSFIGEYCIAMRRFDSFAAGASTSRSRACNSCQPRKTSFLPGSESSLNCSMDCTILTGSPDAGT